MLQMNFVQLGYKLMKMLMHNLQKEVQQLDHNLHLIMSHLETVQL
jgi:hypothetical protein